MNCHHADIFAQLQIVGKLPANSGVFCGREYPATEPSAIAP